MTASTPASVSDPADASAASSRHRVVVIGGGFGGMQVVKDLRSGPFEITLIDWRNFHLFQPLTYQVATGSLSPSDVSYPLRAMFGSSANVRVMLAAVSGFDLEHRRVLLAGGAGSGEPAPVQYDTLVVAAGSSYSYFGHDEWREFAGEVKTLESALSVRSRILTALRARRDRHRSRRRPRRPDVRRRRRRAHRRRDRGPDRRAHARHPARAISPGWTPARCGSCWSRWPTGCWPRSRSRCRPRPRSRWASSASPRGWDRRWSESTLTACR